MASNPLADVGVALKSAADGLPADLKRGLEQAAKPLEQDVQASLRGGLPSRGGLAAKAAKSRVTAVGSVSGDVVDVRVETDGTVNLDRIDTGVVYHPVYGRGSTAQRVKAGLVSDPVNASMPKFEAAAVDVLNAMVDKVGS